MSTTRTKEWEASGWEEDDCNGDVEAAERKLFRRILEHLKRSTMKQLFKEMDKEGSGDLDFVEFRLVRGRVHA